MGFFVRVFGVVFMFFIGLVLGGLGDSFRVGVRRLNFFSLRIGWVILGD